MAAARSLLVNATQFVPRCRAYSRDARIRLNPLPSEKSNDSPLLSLSLSREKGRQEGNGKTREQRFDERVSPRHGICNSLQNEMTGYIQNIYKTFNIRYYPIEC